METHFRGCLIDPCYCDFKRYLRVLLYSFLILIVESVVGFLSGSLALLSDAGHVFSDLLGNIVNLVVEFAVVKKVVKGEKARRWRNVGGYVNAILLFVVAVLVIFDAIERFHHPLPVYGISVIVAAGAGLLLNFRQRKILKSSSATHITHRSGVIHVDSDIWQNWLVIAAGLIVSITHFALCDLIISLFLAVVFTILSFKLIGETLTGSDHHHDH